MRYFIIGFKSSGKTTAGKKLAELLDMEFIDLDEQIESMTGLAVTELFTLRGEEEFRTTEWKALKEVVKKDNLVVATGGGAPCHCDNMALMHKYGKIIYLLTDTDTLVNRLEKETATRPIIRDKSRDELYRYVENLKSQCEHYYLQADYIVEGKNPDVHELAEKLADN